MPDSPQEDTLLLVDPDLDFLDWATKHLFANNLRILRCDNASNALKVIEKTEVSVIVAAMELEPFDGMELLGRIMQQSPKTLVILTAGFPTTGQIIEATQRGAHDVLRKELLVEHSKDLLAHIQALSKRNYAERGPSPDFVILYAPIDAIFIEAVKAIPDFLETSFRLGVTIATPTSMMALLRTVGYLFSRNRVAANAEEIQSLAVKFLRDVSSLHDKIVTVGDRLKSTLKAYNDMIPTAETTVLSAAKKMKSLDVSGKPLKAFPEVSENLRALESKLALDAPEDFIEVEEISDEDDEK
jgi:DNA-binding response OmpR family regulator